MLDLQSIRRALAAYTLPGIGTDLIAINAIQRLEIVDDQLVIDLQLDFPSRFYLERIQTEVSALLQPLLMDYCLVLRVEQAILSHQVQGGLRPHQKIKNILAVASGKGGVGKSTVSANLALALAAEGASVGLLDADIYGPSQCLIFNVEEKAVITGEKTMHPVSRYGVKLMSMAMLLQPDQPVVWRGPMISSVLQQLFVDTDWGQLDYLLVDLPPGTGDVPLTLSQKMPVAGVVMVTTPQDVALLDVRRAINMCAKIDVPVIGIIENMSEHICSQCGHREAIFGGSGTAQIEREYSIERLGRLPLDARICAQTDSGQPIVAADVNGDLARCYRDLAMNMLAKLAQRPKDYAGVFGDIAVQVKSPSS